MTKSLIVWINNASLKDMMYRDRYSPAGDKLFNPGRVFEHYLYTIRRLRAEAGPAEVSRISREIDREWREEHDHES